MKVLTFSLASAIRFPTSFLLASRFSLSSANLSFISLNSSTASLNCPWTPPSPLCSTLGALYFSALIYFYVDGEGTFFSMSLVMRSLHFLAFSS